MNQKRLFASSILAVATILAAIPAQAAIVNLSGYTYNPNESVTAQVVSTPAPYGPTGVGAGQFSGTIDIGSGPTAFNTFCADLYQTFSFNTSYSNYVIQDFTATVAINLSRLFSAHYSEVDTASESAAFQVAVWEILYDTVEGGPNTYLLGSGNFLASGSSIATAQGYLNTLGSVADYQVRHLYSESNQDFLTFVNTGTNTVPEPGSLALFGVAALGGVAASRKRAKT